MDLKSAHSQESDFQESGEVDRLKKKREIVWQPSSTTPLVRRKQNSSKKP